MTLDDILETKGAAIYTIGPEATLQEVTEELVRRNVGSLLVCQRDAMAGEQLLGILTERDILHVCASGRGSLDTLAAKDVMTTRLITASPQDSVDDAMGLMTAHRIRHLPVLSNGRLVGLVSIGDVVKAQHDRLALENHFMKSYIRGGEGNAECRMMNGE
jgi:CBS domain-containing protein